MSAAENIPFELRAIDAEEVGSLLGLAARTVLETIACRPDFPIRLTMRPATWIAGEVLAWREANRAGQPARRRRSGSKSKGSSDPDGQ
jgi:predicted DNA-binding transcriptional regulator AlpA